MISLRLWALLALALPGDCGPPRGLLFPFGSERGDAALEPGDDARSPPLELDTPLHFYGSPVNSLYVRARAAAEGETRPAAGPGWARPG